MADDKVLGEAVIEIRAGLDKLRADLEAVKPVIQKVVEQQERVADNTRQSADAAGGWASKLNGVWTTYNTIVGVARTAFDIGVQIGNVLVINISRAQELANILAGMPAKLAAVSANMEKVKLQKELGDLEQYEPQSVYGRSVRKVLAYITGDFSYQMQERERERVRAQLAEIDGYNGYGERSRAVKSIAEDSFDYDATRRQMNEPYRNELNRLTNALNANTQAILNNPTPR